MYDNTFSYNCSVDQRQQTNFAIYGKIIDRKQMSLLTKVFLISGIGFLFICGIGYSISLIFDNIPNFVAEKSASTLMYISFFGLLVLSILSIYYAFRLVKVSTTFAVLFYIFFIVLEGISFGLLFYSISFFGDYYLNDLILSFGVAGLIFLSMTIWGIKMKYSTARKLSYFLTIMFLIVSIIVINASIFFMSFFWWNSNGNWWFDLVVSGASSVIFSLYIAVMVKRIVSMDEFNLSQVNPQLATKLMFYFSYLMITIFIKIIFLVFRLLRNFKSSS